MYVCIHKLAEDNEILCGTNGEILGCTKKFSEVLKCSLDII